MNKLLQKKQISKIGFLSTVIFVISSSIGAGIFLKDNEILNNTQGSFLFSMIA
jgi:TM2 domain-containing membrane protein YozV